MKGAIVCDQLSVFGGSLQLPLELLLNMTYRREDDIVAVSGTLIEGIGTDCSDFDVYVIGPDRPLVSAIEPSWHHWVTTAPGERTITKEGRIFDTFDYIKESSLAWHVEYTTEEDVRSRLADLRKVYSSLLTHTNQPARFADKLESMLHRMLIAIPLQHGDKLRELLAGLSRDELCYVFYRQYAGGYPQFRDVIGSWRQDDLETAAFMLRNHLVDQMFSLTFLNGDSNHNFKWLFKKLERLAGAGARVAADFRAYYFLAPASRAELRAYILKGLDLLDDIFEAGRELLAKRPAYLPAEEGLRILESEREARKNRHPELDQQLVYRAKMFTADTPKCRDLVHSS